MDRFAVLVDAGYLLSQSVQILSNRQSKARKDVAIKDAEGLIKTIIAHAASALENPNLLRVYWYDGVYGKLSSEQETLSMLLDVQLRQGIVNRSGVQKGVDSKIMADLIELSANHAISDVALITGDGDLVIAIELAQKHGVRVALLRIEDPDHGVPHNQSFEVVCIADRVLRISRSDIAPFLSHGPDDAKPKPAMKAPAPAAPKAAKPAATKKTAASTKKAKAPAKAPAPSPAPKIPGAAADQVLSAIVDDFIAAAEPPHTGPSLRA